MHGDVKPIGFQEFNVAVSILLYLFVDLHSLFKRMHKCMGLVSKNRIRVSSGNNVRKN